MFTAERVAACLFRGLRRRAYHLPGPDALFNLGASVIAGLSPRPHWLIVEVRRGQCSRVRLVLGLNGISLRCAASSRWSSCSQRK